MSCCCSIKHGKSDTIVTVAKCTYSCLSEEHAAYSMHFQTGISDVFVCFFAVVVVFYLICLLTQSKYVAMYQLKFYVHALDLL